MCDLCEDTGIKDCPACSGTGEGREDGTSCRLCRGKGSVGCECVPEYYYEPDYEDNQRTRR
jgi:RecJ-like exonuclease